MANIKNELNNIKSAIYGKDVRGSIHDGIDAINTEVENTTGRQVDLENTFDQLVINAGNSNAEIVDARVKSDGTSYSKLGDRLNEVDSQLAHNTSILENLCINCKSPGFGLEGIKADGVTDDTENLQKIINFAYNSKNKIKIVLPPGNIKISDEIVLKSTTLNSAEFGNIVLEGAGSGSTIIHSYIAEDDKACISVDTSSRINIKNISLINKNKSVRVSGLKITGSSMLCNIENVHAMYFEKGFEHCNCVGTFTNCFANSCKCGFYSCAPGTAITFNSCYASQCKQSDSGAEYDGCGYYINSHYTVLNACASDNNHIAYYVAGGIGLCLNGCGCEVNDYGVVVNNAQAVVKVDNFSYHAITTNVIKLQKAKLLTICNMNFNLVNIIPVYIDYETANDNMIRFERCKFECTNSSLYKPYALPSDGYGVHDYVTNIENELQVGKMVYNGKFLELKILKELGNGRNVNININAMSRMSYAWGDTMINDKVGIKAFGDSTWTSYTKTENMIVEEITTDDTYYIYQIKPGGTQHEANKLTFKIEVYTNSFSINLNNIVLVSGIHY